MGPRPRGNQQGCSIRGDNLVVAALNLRDADVDIPREALVVFSGISGSSKSSLAFGTLYAEAQRRYFESVSPYARRLIDQVGVPEVDSIDGLPPAVALAAAARDERDHAALEVQLAKAVR